MSESYPLPRLGYRISELCAATGLGRTKIYELIASKHLDVVHVGRCTIVKAASVNALLQQQSEREGYPSENRIVGCHGNGQSLRRGNRDGGQP